MFRRHRRGNGEWAPDRAETPEAQMRIIRTHIAAQATELSNVRQAQREIRDLLQTLIEETRGDRPAR